MQDWQKMGAASDSNREPLAIDANALPVEPTALPQGEVRNDYPGIWNVLGYEVLLTGLATPLKSENVPLRQVSTVGLQ